jgi:1,4-dihydroxy-2-naphthoate octaprenyltransferase
VNNVRDRATDARANKRTLVVRFGERFGRAEYAVMVAVAFASAPLMWIAGLGSPFVLLSWMAAPLALAPLRGAIRETGAALNTVLAGTARLQLAFGLLFAVGLSR